MAAWALWLNCWHRAAWDGEGTSPSGRGRTIAQPASASRAVPHPAMTPRRHIASPPWDGPTGRSAGGLPPPPALDQDIDTITDLVERPGAGRPPTLRVSTGTRGSAAPYART